MKSVAFVFIGLAIGLLVALIVTKSGYKVSVNKVSLSPQASTINSSPSTNTSSSPTENTISGGGKLVFVKYEVTYPSSWTATKTSSSQDQETITLRSGGYGIIINQSASGGNMCTYQGDAQPSNEMSIFSKYFVDIVTKDGTVLRRSGDSATSNTFAICSKGSEAGAAYGTITPYGHIDTTGLFNSDPLKLREIDQILSSLNKI